MPLGGCRGCACRPSASPSGPDSSAPLPGFQSATLCIATCSSITMSSHCPAGSAIRVHRRWLTGYGWVSVRIAPPFRRLALGRGSPRGGPGGGMSSFWQDHDRQDARRDAANAMYITRNKACEEWEPEIFRTKNIWASAGKIRGGASRITCANTRSRAGESGGITGPAELRPASGAWTGDADGGGVAGRDEVQNESDAVRLPYQYGQSACARVGNRARQQREKAGPVGPAVPYQSFDKAWAKIYEREIEHGVEATHREKHREKRQWKKQYVRAATGGEGPSDES